MAKFKVKKEAIAPYPLGDENSGKHYFPGDIVELDESDPRVADWLESGIIEAGKKKEEPKKPGPKPKKKEAGE